MRPSSRPTALAASIRHSGGLREQDGGHLGDNARAHPPLTPWCSSCCGTADPPAGTRSCLRTSRRGVQHEFGGAFGRAARDAAARGACLVPSGCLVLGAFHHGHLPVDGDGLGSLGRIGGLADVGIRNRDRPSRRRRLADIREDNALSSAILTCDSTSVGKRLRSHGKPSLQRSSAVHIR